MAGIFPLVAPGLWCVWQHIPASAFR